MQQLEHRLPRRSWRMKRRAHVWFGEHRRLLRYAVIGFAALAALLEIGQLLYPANRTLPFVEAGGHAVGGRSASQAAAVLDVGYADATVTVRTDTKSFQRTLTELRADIAGRDAARRAADYPWWQRLIPFSSVAIMLGRDTPVRATFDDGQLRSFAETVQQEGHADPINASLTVAGGKVKAVPSTPQKDYPAAGVRTALENASIRQKTVITVTPQTTPAALTDKEAGAMIAEVQRLVDDKLVLTLQDKEIAVDKKEVGGWLTFTPDAEAKRLQIGLNKDPAKKYLESIQGDAYKAPGTTHVQLIDDREVSRSVGPSGRGIDGDKAAAAIEQAIKAKGENTVTLTIADIPPVLAYDKKYSNTDTALAALVAQTATKGDYGVSLMEIDGRSAHADGNRRYVAASTYKLYVAYAVIKEVEAGRMSWNESLGARTVAQCFDDMIVISDNSCPHAFGTRIGWRTITNMMHDLGLSESTQLGSAMYTTPNDLAYFLYRVEKGSLLSSAGRTRLIDAMKRQSYTRAGIPKGSGGTVADKVGEVDGYYHDAAIVYGSKKTYVLVVMTYGGSWTGIADVASQVYAAVNK